MDASSETAWDGARGVSQLHSTARLVRLKAAPPHTWAVSSAGSSVC